jgi:hypothetical protein
MRSRIQYLARKRVTEYDFWQHALLVIRQSVRRKSTFQSSGDNFHSTDASWTDLKHDKEHPAAPNQVWVEIIVERQTNAERTELLLTWCIKLRTGWHIYIRQSLWYMAYDANKYTFKAQAAHSRLVRTGKQQRESDKQMPIHRITNITTFWHPYKPVKFHWYRLPVVCN